jgi:hypothetical protein
MQVQYTHQMTDPRHRIEIGDSSYGDGIERVVRNRWDTPTGGFSPHASSEINIRELVPMLKEVFKHHELTNAEVLEIVADAIASIR